MYRRSIAQPQAHSPHACAGGALVCIGIAARCPLAARGARSSLLYMLRLRSVSTLAQRSLLLSQRKSSHATATTT